ncbi:MAG: hypothetical protein M3170_07430 [Candidatus Dormibacteraeota bacterium]|nr:hypothetical protein [Candidatus Dormibacteraeota bacterium]
MALRLCSYLPDHVYNRLTEEARADFDNSLQALLCSPPEEPVGPGCERLRQLVWSVTGPIGLGSRTANLMRLMSVREASGLLSVTALYYVDPWLFNTGRSWDLPAGVEQRLSELAEPVRAVFPRR